MMRAVRVSSPAAAGPAGERMDTGAVGADEADESLRLAIQLQQEELQWHAAAAGAGGAELDEDMRLAMQLSQQQSDGGGDAIM